MFNPNAFFSILRGATWYYNGIYILFKYFASFMGYEDDILEVISKGMDIKDLVEIVIWRYDHWPQFFFKMSVV